MIKETTWVALKEVCHEYGLTYKSAQNSVAYGTFPVPTFKIGRKTVIDKEVHKRFFDLKREAGLLALNNNQ